MKKNANHNQTTERFSYLGQYDYVYEDQAPALLGSDPDPKPPRKKEGISGKKVLIFSLLFLVVLCVAVIILINVMCRLRNVYIVGADEYSQQLIVNSSGLVKGQSLLQLDKDAVKKSIQENRNIEVKRVEVDYPSSVYIYVRLRNTSAILLSAGIYYELDPEGYVIRQINEPLGGYPVVTGMEVDAANVGQILSVSNSQRLDAYRILMHYMKMYDFLPHVEKIMLDNINIYITLRNGVLVRFGNAEKVHEKIVAIITSQDFSKEYVENSVLNVTIPESPTMLSN